MTILSLCDLTGTWPQPYRAAGYDVISVDIQRGEDVRLMRIDDLPPIRGVLAAVPCTEFASSGARWWAGKPPELLLEALAVMDACIRIIHTVRPMWHAIENPSGRMSRFIGPADYSFDPCDFGDPYTKRTHLWGRFNHPLKRPVHPTEGSKMHKVPPGPNRQNIRSATPLGFARAFFEANP
jgi:hypothetical protein